MAEAEQPERLTPAHRVTIEDVRQLMGSSTPHFALQIRNRIRRLIRGLPVQDPVRLEGEREIARLERIALTGEIRGEPGDEGMPPLPSVDADAPTRRVTDAVRR